jgi:hypothetical protein
MTTVDFFVVLGAIYVSHEMHPGFRLMLGSGCFISALVIAVISK